MAKKYTPDNSYTVRFIDGLMSFAVDILSSEIHKASQRGVTWTDILNVISKHLGKEIKPKTIAWRVRKNIADTQRVLEE